MRLRERSEKPAFSASLRCVAASLPRQVELCADREREDVSNAGTCAARAASCSAKPSTTPAAATNVLAVTVPLSPPTLGCRAIRLPRGGAQNPGADRTEQWLAVAKVRSTGPPPTPGVLEKEAVSC
jgi:hypothetical protein